MTVVLDFVIALVGVLTSATIIAVFLNRLLNSEDFLKGVQEDDGCDSI